MLSVEEALERVLSRAQPRAPVSAPCSESLGLVLAEEITSDVDSPPHDKSIVDGYAVIAADLASGPVELALLEEVMAGDVPRQAVVPGTTIRVMTGAPLPAGADAMVMVEQSEMVGERVRLTPPRVTLGQNIIRRATSMARGERVLSAGHELRAIELGLLGEVGRTQVQVVPRPRLAVLSTGNELVSPGSAPGPGHIRNSNSPMLVALAQAAGAASVDLGIARDEPEELRSKMSAGLEADVLVISGGVSAGVLDLVPGVLEALGVEPVFHKIRLKPGKPLWFGVLAAEGGSKLVFGLPGNPVSSLVGFELFVRPAIAKLAGRSPAADETTATLASEFVHRGDRPTYHPAELRCQEGVSIVEPLKWKGSGDLRTLAGANALACFAAGDRRHAAGETIRVLRLR